MASCNAQLKIKNAHIMVGDEGYFDWVDVADVRGETVAVGSAFDPTPTAAASDLSGTILQLIMDVDSIAKSSDTMSVSACRRCCRRCCPCGAGMYQSACNGDFVRRLLAYRRCT